jgi:FlaA1/EpsC-like NDP-sugar epimerase
MGRGGELYVLKMGEPLGIVQLAEDLIRLSGLNPEDIGITFSGLRPGEKLQESLWERDAVIHDTEHPDILNVVEPEAVEPARLGSLIETLATLADGGDRQTMDVILTELIPTFAPPRLVTSA